MKNGKYFLMVSLLALLITSCSRQPAPGSTPSPTGSPPPPYLTPVPSGYEPQSNDWKLHRDPVSIEIENSSLTVNGQLPAEVSAVLKGNLPNQCHQLRVKVNIRIVVTDYSSSHRIDLEVYSVVDSGQTCTAGLQPFEVTIPLGGFSGGHYNVYVNEKLLGEFNP